MARSFKEYLRDLGLAALAAWLELSVEWVFAALLGDWLVKALLLVWRFRSGRWQHVFDREQPA